MTHSRGLEWRTEVDAGSGIRVYRLAGVVTDSSDTFAFIERVRTDMRSDPRPVLLDMGEVGQLTSAGAGMVATIYSSAQNANTALSGLNSVTRRLLQIVHLLAFIATFGDEKEALAAYSKGGWAPGS